MLCGGCCGICSKMNRRADYKVSTVESLELEPLGGGPKPEGKRNGINKYGGDSTSGRPTRDGVAVCSQKRALCVTAIVLGTLLGTALVIAYAGPQSVCPCAGKMPPGFVPEGFNNTEPFQPISTNGQPFPWLHPYLPNNVRPNRYMLTIHPNLTTFDVKGQVTIEFNVEKDTNFIVIHAQDLNITEKAVVGPKGYAFKILKLLEYQPRQQIYIELRDKLKKKLNYTLSLRWHSRLVFDPEGFYVDEYDGANGFKRLLAATVLGPGAARKAFPCFDEPHLRAPFRISLFRDRFHLGLSNSIVHATDDVGFYMGTGLLRDDFIETPPLPPDAIAWVISDFERELLEPSTTYQVTTSTSATPSSSLLSSIASSSKNSNNNKLSTDNSLAKLKSDKRPLRNITAVLKKGLSISLNNQDDNNNNHHHNVPILANLVHSSADNATDLDIKTAPSYTFYASEDTLKKSKFILLTSRDVLEYLQTWLNVPYPLTKLDFVALPSLNQDLTSSLGLITCRQSFLREPDSITTEEYHMSAIKISEAIVKQYFGGLISPRIWKHSWLWEGLIKYLGRFILSPLQPLWPMDEIFLMQTVTKALDIDSLQGWENIIQGTSENGNNEDFYIDKSAAILSMMYSAIEEDNFRGCLGKFLNTYKYQTAEPSDLWQLCTKQVNFTKNIKEMMSLWTTLPGFPLLNVTKKGSTITLSQKPFQTAEFLAILEEPDFDNDTELISTTMPTTTTTQSSKKVKPIKWIFPVKYITNTEKIEDTLWFNTTETTFSLHYDVKWIKLNSEQNGYYRVLYDDDNWVHLIEQLKTNHKVFSAKDRIGLVSDAFTLCHANLMSCEITMSLISYLPKEFDWGPMTTGLRHLERWRKILKYSECFLMLTEYVRAILAKSVQEIGWNDVGKDEIKLLRPEVLLASVLWEEPAAIAQAKQMLQILIANSTAIAPNLRGVAYIGAVLSGEFTYWQYCWNRYTQLRKEKERADERLELLRALGVTKDAWLQNRLLSHVVTLPTTEIVQVLEAIAGTPTGGAMACRFLQAKWFDIQSKLGKGSLNFARVISAITQYGATKFDYDELKSLVERFGEGHGIRALNMTLSTVAANVEWVSRSQSIIYNWVENN